MIAKIKNIPVSIGIFWDPSDDGAISLWMQKRDDIEETRYNGLWEFPGGKIEAGENITEAVIREIQEEAGLDISHEERIRFFGYYRIERDEINILIHVFLIYGDKSILKGGRWFRFHGGENAQKIRDEILPPNEQIINDIVQWIGGVRKAKKESMAWN